MVYLLLIKIKKIDADHEFCNVWTNVTNSAKNG